MFGEECNLNVNLRVRHLSIVFLAFIVYNGMSNSWPGGHFYYYLFQM